MGAQGPEGESGMREFFAMGGYAAYVWSAYALTCIVLVANWVLARRRHKQVLNELRNRVLNEK